MKCPHCDAYEENIAVSFTADDTTEYAHYTCMYCGWEWGDASVINWAFDDNELLTAGMA
jgi:hypothetical protein